MAQIISLFPNNKPTQSPTTTTPSAPADVEVKPMYIRQLEDIAASVSEELDDYEDDVNDEYDSLVQSQFHCLSAEEEQRSVLRHFIKTFHGDILCAIPEMLDYMAEGSFDIHYVTAGDMIIDYRIFDPYNRVVEKGTPKDYDHPGCTYWHRGICTDHASMFNADFSESSIKNVLAEDNRFTEDGLMNTYSEFENMDIIIESFRL